LKPGEKENCNFLRPSPGKSVAKKELETKEPR